MTSTSTSFILSSYLTTISTTSVSQSNSSSQSSLLSDSISNSHDASLITRNDSHHGSATLAISKAAIFGDLSDEEDETTEDAIPGDDCYS